MRKVIVLGSTGSIGTQALEVIAKNPDLFQLSGVSYNSSAELALKRAADFGLSSDLVARGPVEAAALVRGTEADVVLNGITGSAGLAATLAALETGKTLALANKESLIAGGPVVQPLRATPGAELVPVDSEHCAIHQCLRSGQVGPVGLVERVGRLVLTASGGPFRGRSAADLAAVTVDEALNHPTWSMGPKITIDSSTLMNKGLEVIEAHELFGVGYDDIDVVVHPQSVVHSMVEFTDGSTIAQLSMPDMKLPIGYALAYPDRIATPFGRIDWSTLRRLDFEPPDVGTFRCLGLAYEAGRIGGSAPAWLNAANEVAVQAFLDRRLTWSGIAEVLEECLELHDGTPATSVDVVIDVDRRSRRVAEELIGSRG